MTVLDRIKKVSKMRGYNLTKVNDLANLGKNTIYSWKNKEPSHNNVQAVADVLGISVDYLLGNTDDMHNIKKDDEPIDLYTVSDDERDKMISANGQPISDEDWAIIKAVLARYPKRD